MKRNIGNRLLFIATAFAAFVSSAVHAQVEISGELGAPIFDYRVTSDTFADVTVPATTLPGVNLNFSELGETTLTFELSAPEAQLLEVEVPDTGWDDGGIAFSYIIERGSGTTQINPAVTVDFIEGEGDLPVFSGERSILTNANQLYVTPSTDLTPGQTFRFRSMRVSIVVPESYSNTFTGGGTRFELNLYLSAFGGSPADPGEWIRFVDAPEPTPVVLPQTATPANPALQAKIKSKLKKLKAKLRILVRGDDSAKIARLEKKIRGLEELQRRG